jgi:hypothetical protein
MSESMAEPLYDLLDGNWSSVKAVAAVKDQLYVLDEDTHVYRVDPIGGEYLESLGRFEGDHLVVVNGEPLVFKGPATSLGNRVFTIEDRSLYSINGAGEWECLDNSWDTRHLIGLGDALFAWEDNNTLYRVDPNTGHATVLDNSWPLVGGVATACGKLYAVDGGILYQVDPQTGHCDEIADRMRTRLLVGVGSSLYSFEHNGDLYRYGVG